MLKLPLAYLPQHDGKGNIILEYYDNLIIMAIFKKGDLDLPR